MPAMDSINENEEKKIRVRMGFENDTDLVFVRKTKSLLGFVLLNERRRRRVNT